MTPARVLGKALRVFLALALLGHVLLFLVVLVSSLYLRSGNPPSTALMVYRRVTQHESIRPVHFVRLRQIPRSARSMVIRLEDYRFYQHPGVDLGALRDAYLINHSLRATVVGGSTIPMQLARNLFLTPRKTYFRKYLECLVALEMDLIVPKDRILEIYLNYIEWGRGIFGIGEAALYYYHTPIWNLSLDELRRLITIITNPRAYSVFTFERSRQMTARYAYLVERFPDQASAESAAPTEPPPPALLNPDTAEEPAAPAGPPAPAAPAEQAGAAQPAPVVQAAPVPAPATTPAPAPPAVSAQPGPATPGAIPTPTTQKPQGSTSP